MNREQAEARLEPRLTRQEAEERLAAMFDAAGSIAAAIVDGDSFSEEKLSSIVKKLQTKLLKLKEEFLNEICKE